MNGTEIINLICQRLQDAATARRAGRIEVNDETATLGGTLLGALCMTRAVLG